MRLAYAALVNLICLAVIIGSLQGCAPAIFAGSAAGAASIASDKRSTGTIIDDQAIEFRLAGKLQSDNEMTDSTNINVTCYNSTVLLTGEAPSQALIERAEAYAKQDSKIKRVYNEINVREPLPFKARNYDTWLTTKIKTKLLTTKDVSGADVKVVTSDTTVYLMGILPRNEADLITQTISDVQGVTRIVKAFEYME
jgi:osmotically-inducible protein OsmY